MTYRARPPRRMPEQWKSMYVPLAGGLVDSASPIGIDPGRLLLVNNFESIYGQQGYRTIKGYERYDGRGTSIVANLYQLRFRSGSHIGTGQSPLSPGIGINNLGVVGRNTSAVIVSYVLTSGSWLNGDATGVMTLSDLVGDGFTDNDALKIGATPWGVADGVSTPIYEGDGRPSSAQYAVLTFDTGTAAISAGDTVTSDNAASGLVVSVEVSSGSYAGGDAAGTIVITSFSGRWRDDDAIKVGGTQKATANGEMFVGTRGDEDLHVTRMTAARNLLRSYFQKPTGSGPILGGCVFNENVYVVRNHTDNNQAKLWRASTAGWVEVADELEPGGDYKFEVANFTGDPSDNAVYFVSGRGRLRKMDLNEFVTTADPVFGTESVSSSAVPFGTGVKSFTLDTTSRSYAVDDLVIVRKRSNPGEYMVGPVTGYNSGTNVLGVNVTESTGSGSNSAWEIGLSDYSDRAHDLVAHKDHLFLVFGLGQLQTSNLGDPMTYTTTAALFGLGAEITGIVSLKGELLAIFTGERIHLLSGTSATDWSMQLHTKSVGAQIGTVQDVAGNAIFLDDRGITTLQATQNYGDFESAILSRNARKTIDAYRQRIIGCRMVKGYNQYRLYFDDGTNLRMTILTGNPVPTEQDVAFTLSKYDHAPTCFFSGKLDGVERYFFGTDDGYLMEEDIGTSFDGASITYSFRLPFNHAKSPGVTKRWHKMLLELQAPDPVTVSYRSFFSMDDPALRHDGGDIESLGAGGYWDDAYWDTFRLDQPIMGLEPVQMRGVGNSLGMVMFFSSDFVRPVAIQGYQINFSILGIER